MSNLITRTTRMHILPRGEPIFSELAYTVEIEDDSGGEYIHLKDGSITGDKDGIKINPEDWPTVREAIDRMVDQIKEHEKGAK